MVSPDLLVRQIKPGASDVEDIRRLCVEGFWPTFPVLLDELLHGYHVVAGAAVSCLTGALASLPFKSTNARITAALCGTALLPVAATASYQYYLLPWISRSLLDKPFFEQCSGERSREPEHQGSAVWVAEMNGRVVGTVSLLQGPDQEYELKRMYVDSSVRGAGIGSALVQELLRHAKKQQDCKSIKLITSGAKQPAVKFYEKCGWSASKVRHVKVYDMDAFRITIWEMKRAP